MPWIHCRHLLSGGIAVAGRTRCLRRGTGAACCRAHSGCRRDPHTACEGPRVSLFASGMPAIGWGQAYERYETERKGFWLNTSLSKNLLSSSHDIGYHRRFGAELWRGGLRARMKARAGGTTPTRMMAGRQRAGQGCLRRDASRNLDMKDRAVIELSHGRLKKRLK